MLFKDSSDVLQWWEHLLDSFIRCRAADFKAWGGTPWRCSLSHLINGHRSGFANSLHRFVMILLDHLHGHRSGFANSLHGSGCCCSCKCARSIVLDAPQGKGSWQDQSKNKDNPCSSKTVQMYSSGGSTCLTLSSDVVRRILRHGEELLGDAP